MPTAPSPRLLSADSTELVATFDGEALIDQRARRPVVHISHGVNEGLTWPVIQMRAGTDRAGADVCYLVGPEPDFRWPSFVASVVTLAGQLGVRLVVGLGAFPAPAPHTRPVRLAATAPRESADLVERVGIVQGEIDVPSGVWGALELAFGEAGIPTVGLWARVPHYVSGMALPSASAALLDGLAAVGDLSVDSTDLHTAADASLQQVDDLIAKSAEHTSMVRQLERSVDAAEGNPLDVGTLPDRRRAGGGARALPTRRAQRRQSARRALSQRRADGLAGVEPLRRRSARLLDRQEVDDEHERLVGSDGGRLTRSRRSRVPGGSRSRADLRPSCPTMPCAKPGTTSIERERRRLPQRPRTRVEDLAVGVVGPDVVAP